MKSAPASAATRPFLLRHALFRQALSVRRLFVAVVGFAFITAALVPAGCVSRAKPIFNGVTEDVDMPDVPVPFEFRRLSSWAYDEFDFRSWQGRYTGKMKLRDAADFYHDQMPKEGWLLLSSYPGATRRVLVFSKGTEEQAVVDIRRQYDPDPRVKAYRTVVAIEVKPTPPDELAIDSVLSERGARTTESLEADRIDAKAIPARQVEGDEPPGELLGR